MKAGADSHRALVLAPTGRDSALAASILTEAGLPACICADVVDLCRELERGAAVAVVVEEALQSAFLPQISAWIERQPPWSDFPFVVLSQRGGGLERNPAVRRLSGILGNVNFLERPFHPTTLVSVIRTALRGRLRQYEARERMEEIRRGEALLERRVVERTLELGEVNRQLEQQIADRERAEGALRQAQRLEAVGQLTAGVAHDFNNLLMVVLGNARRLRQGTDDPATARRLDLMTQAAERGASLTAQLLAFSRQQKLEPRAVDLNASVRNMLGLLQSTLGGSIQIDTDLSPELWPALIDPTQIELVVLNLAINARDAMEVGGALTVRTANVVTGEPERPEHPAAGEYAMIAVGDDGSGMTAEVVAKAFEPFFTTKPVGKGSGLGLSQVLGLAKQSGGGVRIDTEPGRGTTVQIFLPRADVEVRAAPAPAPAAQGAADDRTILVVDDDAAVREVTAGMLSALGYAVVEADGGRAALDLLDGRRVDAVILDFAMPGMNGAEAARAIAALRPGLPVILATGYADASAFEDARQGRLLRKPFSEAELSGMLSEALRPL